MGIIVSTTVAGFMRTIMIDPKVIMRFDVMIVRFNKN